ncbi:hypothetical protein Tco_0630463 [Tanacetum coccineum]
MRGCCCGGVGFGGVGRGVGVWWRGGAWDAVGCFWGMRWLASDGGGSCWGCCDGVGYLGRGLEGLFLQVAGLRVFSLGQRVGYELGGIALGLCGMIVSALGGWAEMIRDRHFLADGSLYVLWVVALGRVGWVGSGEFCRLLGAAYCCWLWSGEMVVGSLGVGGGLSFAALGGGWEAVVTVPVVAGLDY